MITAFRRGLRAWKIRRLEQDIEWARASCDAHIQGIERELMRLRAEQDARTSAEVARDISRATKGVA